MCGCLYGNRFEIFGYKFNGKNNEYILRFTVYDIFGLDEADIIDTGFIFIKFGKIQEFQSWYIRQHCNLYRGDYQPYFSYMTFERTIKGSIE
ncbi:MAG: DUF3289 family protein [Coprococcus sp.]|nr:DUF3289 family protein [Coprococcus sp.]